MHKALMLFGKLLLLQATTIEAVNLRSSAATLLYSQKVETDVDAQFDRFLEDWFDDFMVRKPMEALRFGRQLPSCQGLGAKSSSHVHEIWGDASAAAEKDGVDKDLLQLEKMIKRFHGTIGSRDLSDERHVSYILMQKKVEEMKQEHTYRAFRPPFGPLGCQVGVMGCQVQTFGMIRNLAINTVDDARCYIALMNGLPDFLQQHGQRLQEAVSHGSPPYRLVLEAVVKDCDGKLPSAENATSQSESASSSDLFKVFAEKVKGLKGVDDKQIHVLLQDAEQGIINGIWPAYRGLRGTAQSLLPKALDSVRGLSASHSKEASDFYSYRVKLLGVGGDASSLQKRALELVNENAQEIDRSAQLLSNSSTELSRTTVMKVVRKAYSEARYENSEAGRETYLKDVQGYIDSMWKSLRQTANSDSGRLFFHDDVPVLPCPVKRIQSSSFPGLAQYTPGSIGKINRSASVGFNVYDMGTVSKLDMEVLAYHEVVPGHHLQVTKTLALPLPSFRRYFGDEAFAEGWAVYAEQDLSPRLADLSTQSLLGRLNLRQTKAVRLAVDTGLHAFDWDRKKAEAFYVDYTMVTPERAAKAVDRHFAWPAQALNYAAGHQEVLRVRQAVENKPALVHDLGKDWEAMLHKAILSHGDLPLAMLEQVVFAQLHAWSTTAHHS
jgi:uncharacterized protein (DUF885 family)